MASAWLARPSTTLISQPSRWAASTTGRASLPAPAMTRCGAGARYSMRASSAASCGPRGTSIDCRLDLACLIGPSSADSIGSPGSDAVDDPSAATAVSRMLPRCSCSLRVEKQVTKIASQRL
nr:hypothetical protein [Sphingobacterium sp. N143]